MTAAERALFAERMREAEAEHVAYADECGTPPYKHARDVALACRLAAMVAEPSAKMRDAIAYQLARDDRGLHCCCSDAKGPCCHHADRADSALTALLSALTGAAAAEEAQT